MGSSWAGRVRTGVVSIVTTWGVISMAPAAAEVAVRPVAHDARDGRPFAIVDKRQALLSVYAADGRLIGRTAALLGLTPGDTEPASARGKAPSAGGTGFVARGRGVGPSRKAEQPDRAICLRRLQDPMRFVPCWPTTRKSMREQ